MLNGAGLRTIAKKPVPLIPPQVRALRPLARLRRLDLPKSSNIENLDAAKSLLLLVELAKAGRWADFGFVEQGVETIPVEAAQKIIPSLLKDGHVPVAQEIYDKIAFPQAKKKSRGPIILRGPAKDLKLEIKRARQDNGKSPLDLFDSMIAGELSLQDFFWSLPVAFENKQLIKFVTRQRFTPETYCFLRETAFCQRVKDLAAKKEGRTDEEQVELGRYYFASQLLRAMINQCYEKAAAGSLKDDAGQAIVDLIFSDTEYDFLPPKNVLPQLIARGRKELAVLVGNQEKFSVTEKNPAALFVCVYVLEPQAKGAELKKAGKFKEAMAVYATLDEVIPRDKDLIDDKVTCLYEWAVALNARDGQTQRPLELMKQAHALSPDHVGVMGVLSYFYCLEDDYRPAIPILEKLMKEQEGVYAQLNEQVASAKGFVADLPLIVEPKAMTAASTLRSQYAEAQERLAIFEKGYADSLTNFGHCYYLKYLETEKLEDLDQAKELLKRAVAMSASPYTNFCLAMVCSAKRDYGAALQQLKQRLTSAHASLAFMSFLEKTMLYVDLENFDEEAFLDLGKTIKANDMNRSRCSKASSLIDSLLEKGLRRLPVVLLAWMNRAVEEKGDELGENDFLGGEQRLDTEVDALIVAALNKMDPELAMEDCLARLEKRPSSLMYNTLGGLHLEQGNYQEAVTALEQAISREDMPHLLLPLINMLEAYRKIGEEHNYKRTLKRLYKGIDAAMEANVVGQFKFMSYYRVLFEEEKRILAERPNLRPAVQRVLTLLEQNFAEQYAKARATFDSPSI